MPDPITWRNVVGPAVHSDPIRPLALAGQSFNDAFGAIRDVLKQTQSIDANNVAVGNENQKNAYLDALNGAKTPEELAALQSSGVLDQHLAALDPISRAAVRGAQEARLTAVRQQTLAGQEFTDKETDRAQQPIRDKVLAEAYAGNHKGALDLLAQNPGLRNSADLAKAITTSQREGSRFTWDEQQAKRSQAAEQRAADAFAVSNPLAKIQLEEAQTRQADTETSRDLQDQLGTVAGAYQKQFAKDNQDIAAEAKTLGLSLNSDGTLNLATLTSDQRAKLNGVLKEKGLSPVEVLERGNTAAKDNFITSLRASGKYKAGQIDALDAAATKAFDTTGSSSIGNDAATQAARKAQKDALEREAQFRLGIPATEENLKGLRETIDSEVAKLAKPGTWRYESYRRQANEFLDRGYTVKDPVTGKDTKFVPSPEKLAQLLGKTNTSYGVLGLTGFYQDDISKPLDEWAKSHMTKEQADAALSALKRESDEKVLKALSKKHSGD